MEVDEVDHEGRFIAAIAFDPEDRRAASVEMFERWARSDAGRSQPASVIELRRAIRERDLVRVRATLPEDFVFHDRRRLGAGRVARPDEYVVWLAALFEQSPDAIMEPIYELAAAHHGALSVARTFGTLAQGGEFESVFLALWTFRNGRPASLELFDLEDFNAAHARFEELRPDPLHVPPNEATRSACRLHEAGDGGSSGGSGIARSRGAG